MSEKIKILSPVVECYGITVSIPMSTPFVFNQKRAIYEAKEFFMQKRDCVTSHKDKVEFDRARALLKYAGCWGAKLEKMRCEDEKLKVTMSFCTLEDLVSFKDSMATAVSDSTMK